MKSRRKSSGQDQGPEGSDGRVIPKPAPGSSGGSFTSLSLGFPISKMGIIIIPGAWVCYED